MIQRAGGNVIEFNDPCCRGNFIEIEVEINDKKLHILLNKHYPIVAFALNVECGSIKFIDEPILTEFFAPFYQVQSYLELNEQILMNLGSESNPLQNDHELNQAELNQIVYWKPRTVGEIIFNIWD